MTNENALTVREAAVHLRCTIPYIYSLLHAERVPGAYRVDGEWRLPKSAVMEHQDKQARRAKTVSKEHAQREHEIGSRGA